jgi:hypothetical protein
MTSKVKLLGFNDYLKKRRELPDVPIRIKKKKVKGFWGDRRFCSGCGLLIAWKTRTRHCPDCLAILREKRKNWGVYKKLREKNIAYELEVLKIRARNPVG